MMTGEPFPPRGFLAGLGTAAVGITFSGLAGCKKHPAQMVNFYNWDTYVGKNTLSGFEKASGIGVNMSLYSNNDELFAKLRGGNPGYDVVVPANDFVQRMAKANMLMPLDHAKIPNMKNILPRFQDAPFDPGRKYAMPYTWLVLGIGYRKSKIQGVPDSWKWVLDSPQYKGRIAVLSDAADLCRLTEIYLGADMNTFDKATLAKVQDLLIRQKGNIATFHDDNGQDLLLSGDCDIVIEYNGDIAQVMREDKDLAFVVPKEGSILQSDQLCIPPARPTPMPRMPSSTICSAPRRAPTFRAPSAIPRRMPPRWRRWTLNIATTRRSSRPKPRSPAASMPITLARMPIARSRIRSPASARRDRASFDRPYSTGLSGS
jgi:spermidine/putrescine transport system substrate-binding protein